MLIRSFGMQIDADAGSRENAEGGLGGNGCKSEESALFGSKGV
jgi:hypothetical protein